MNDWMIWNRIIHNSSDLNTTPIWSLSHPISSYLTMMIQHDCIVLHQIFALCLPISYNAQTHSLNMTHIPYTHTSTWCQILTITQFNTTYTIKSYEIPDSFLTHLNQLQSKHSMSNCFSLLYSFFTFSSHSTPLSLSILSLSFYVKQHHTNVSYHNLFNQISHMISLH